MASAHLNIQVILLTLVAQDVFYCLGEVGGFYYKGGS